MGRTTPRSKTSVVHETYQRFWGKDDPSTLVWRAPTRVMNPLILARIVEAALERDEVNARSEWLAEFVADDTALVTDAALRVVVAGQREDLPRLADADHVAVADVASARARTAPGAR